MEDCGLKIQGQIVNNTFVGCNFLGFNNGVYINGTTYQGSIRRPEGCMFLGGLIGAAKWGVFNSCMINGVMYWDDGTSGLVTNCQWGGAPTTKARIIKKGTGIVRQSLNMFKQNGTLIVTSGTK
jgi:hypothetical protein